MTAEEIYSLFIVCIGLVLNLVLFRHFPLLPANDKTKNGRTVSVIIPARNEEENLKRLLGDLQAQTLQPHEVICVDDNSKDDSARIIGSFDVSLISLRDKPESWTGKNWACHNGAIKATGELLLFLDADVRLGPDGLARLLQAYRENNCTISVQPYHDTKELYEQPSLIFNLTQLAANGTTLPWNSKLGLHGPVILISKADYEAIGGHESVRDIVVEDLALGQKLKELGLSFKLYIGDPQVSYRMYSNGFRSLFQGWVKNFATGAANTSLLLFVLIFFWIGSITNSPRYLIQYAIGGNSTMVFTHGILYLVWVLVLYLIAKKIGRFNPIGLIFFPIHVLIFLIIFLVSVFTRLFDLPILWKDRVIAGKRKA